MGGGDREGDDDAGDHHNAGRLVRLGHLAQSALELGAVLVDQGVKNAHEEEVAVDDDVDDDAIPPDLAGHRHYLVALGAELTFPNIHERGGGIPAGRDYYIKAARYFSDKDVAKAIAVLEQMAEERSGGGA
jgi:hypothetical protein